MTDMVARESPKLQLLLFARTEGRARFSNRGVKTDDVRPNHVRVR